MLNFVVRLAALTLFSALQSIGQTVWLDELDLTSMQCGWGTPESRKSVEGNPLRLAGVQYDRGIGTHAVSTFLLHLDGMGIQFHAFVGVDDEASKPVASMEFAVVGDRNVLWHSGVMKAGEKGKEVNVDVRGVKLLGLLVTDAGDGIDYDHADWCDARLETTRFVKPEELAPPDRPSPYILTPATPLAPRINGAALVGVRPWNPFLYRIAATGKRPMTFSARNLPVGLALDTSSGIIRGVIDHSGGYAVEVTARNVYGSSARNLRIHAGEAICMTPPMGWNSWNCWACAVDDGKVRAAADALVSSGLIDHGWTYVNIDDCWSILPGTVADGAPRDSAGMINCNRKFPNMQALAAYVHGLGLKLGIYSSPGPTTCAGYTASYQHEKLDANRFASWGIDYLKYDWCSYGEIAKNPGLADLEKPYVVMRAALDDVRRDIVFSLCQYGMGKVWEWGASVGGNCWRTTGDITDSWSSVAGIGFGQAGHDKFAGPGHWNDPDMLVVGRVGWGPELHASRLTPDEQYTHISLWCLLSAPLLIGCDLTALDPFTLGLLSNDEVLAVDQDPAGHQAKRISDTGGTQIWVKDMEDGSKAVGLFNVGGGARNSLADYFEWSPVTSTRIEVAGSELGFTGKFMVRDLWRQKDLGVFEGTFSAEVPRHGVVLVKIVPADQSPQEGKQ